MAFWGRRQAGGRDRQWREFARTLELAETLEMAEKLRHNLDLGPGDIAPVYSLTRSGQPQLVLFEQSRARSGPTGTVASVRSCVLLRANGDADFVSLRATARRNKVLESLEAGRTGSSRIEAGDDPEFDSRVSVYARDTAGAARLLTDAVKAVMLRLVDQGGPATDEGDIPATVARTPVPPSLVVGNKNLLLVIEGSDPIGFERYTDLTADMLALYAAIRAGA